VPDPNDFGGTVRIQRAGDRSWHEVPLTFGYTGGNRGIGVADLAYALRSGRQHRVNGDIAYHALEIMHAFQTSSDTGRYVELLSTCSRPAPLPLGLREGTLDP
jgi:hypothetical protein